MPFQRPNLDELRQQTRGFFAGRLPGADTTLRRSNITVTADAMAGLANGEYGYLDWLAKQPFASTSDADALLRQGSEYGLAPFSGTNAAGSVIFTGISTTDIPSGTLAQSSLGIQVQTTEDATIADGTATVPVETLTTGSDGNLAVGAPLVLVNAVSGVNATASVADDGDGGGLTGGTDDEDIEDFRARVLTRKQQPPQGGDEDDYETWATIAGVTRVWVLPLNRGNGTVDVSFVMDGRDDIIPTPDDVAAVQAAIDAFRPVTDDCIAFAPTPLAVNFTIGGTQASARLGITAALQALFGTTVLAGGLSFQDEIVPAIAGGAGASPFDVTSPSADVSGAAGTLLLLGTITFT